MNKFKFVSLFCIAVFLLCASLTFGQEYRGAGDDVISITKPVNGPVLLYISGNSGGNHFAVKGYDDNGSMTSLLVNTTDTYSGVVPLDLGKRKSTSTLEISANGSWSVKIRPIDYASKINPPDISTGSNDDVLWIDGNAKIAQISGNDQGRHFAVKCYDKYGNLKKLLLNTTNPYNGKVLLPKNALLLEVSAVGGWTILLK